MKELFSEDITVNDLSTAIRLFKESKAAFLKLFNNSPVCMSMTTTNLGKRTYVKVNKKFIDIFGFTEAEIIGRTSLEIGILDEPESIRVGEIIKEKGRLQNDYVKCISKSGKIVHTISSIEYMETKGEIYLVAFFVDITKVIEQQAVIEQNARQLEVLNKELESFSYSVSHDLRAPLRAINGYAKILEEDFYQSLDEEGKRMLNTIQHNAKMMGDLIDDLLKFSKLGRKEIQLTTIDMKFLIQEVLREINAAAEHHAQIKLGVLHPLQGDYTLMKQVFINLISNSIKYSSKKEKPLVEINSEIKEGEVIYQIKDNGVGFDMQYADKLFGVFQRLHSNEEFEGTGVGLAIVKRIIHKHGGRVGAEGEMGKGATFTFALPVT